MRKKGHRTSTTWAKGKKPPVGRKKGTPNKRTAIKRAIGLENWESLKKYVREEGAGKMLDQMKRMKPKEFKVAFLSLLEFVEPKLQRVDAKLKVNLNLQDEEIVFE